MKIIILLNLILLSTFATSQEYCKFMPYKINNKYGIVNDKQEKTINPIYNKLEIIDEYSFALFDDVNCYDLNTGKYVKIKSLDNKSFVVICNELFIFNRVKNELENPFTKEKINLKLKYLNFKNLTFYDYKTKKRFNIIQAKTSDSKIIFYNNSKFLKEIFDDKITNNDFEIIYMKIDGLEYDFGIMKFNKGIFTIYNYDFSKSFQLKQEDFEKLDENSIKFKKTTLEKYNDFYGYKSDEYPLYFFINSGVSGTGGDMNKSIKKYFNYDIQTILLGNGFSLFSRNNEYILKIQNKHISDKVKYDGIYQLNLNRSHLYIKFDKILTNETIQIFVNHRKINPAILMFPKEELIRFELVDP